MIVPCKSEASFLHVYHLPGTDLKVWDFLKSWLYMGPLPQYNSNNDNDEENSIKGQRVVGKVEI